MQVGLFKKEGTYTNSEGVEKRFVNFYLRCGDSLIPVEPCFFPDKEKDNKDYQYAGRKEVMKAFAETLPDKEKPVEKTVATAESNNKTKPRLIPDDDPDGNIPF